MAPVRGHSAVAVAAGGIRLESMGGLCYASPVNWHGKRDLGRTITIAPSILSADFAYLAEEIARAGRGGADLLHVDVMDGHFVPNITLGPPVVSSIRKVTELPLDAHLMIEEPGRYIADFVRAGANWISVHVETEAHLNRTVNHIKDFGALAGVALNPGTPLSV